MSASGRGAALGFDQPDHAFGESIVIAVWHGRRWQSLEAAEYETLEWVRFASQRRLKPTGNVSPAEAGSNCCAAIEPLKIAIWNSSENGSSKARQVILPVLYSEVLTMGRRFPTLWASRIRGPRMYTHAQKLKDPEVQELRKAGGLWLRELREKRGLSQRQLAGLIGADYYTFISQLETGRGRIPPDRYIVWAAALGVKADEFVKQLMRFYDPVTYDILFAKAG